MSNFTSFIKRFKALKHRYPLVTGLPGNSFGVVPQVPLTVREKGVSTSLATGAQFKLTNVGDDKTIVAYGGTAPYEYSLYSNNPQENVSVSITQDMDNGRQIIEGIQFGVSEVLVKDTINYQKKIVFIVEPKIRDVNGNIITNLDLLVGETKIISFYCRPRGSSTFFQHLTGLVTMPNYNIGLNLFISTAGKMAVTGVMAGSGLIKASRSSLFGSPETVFDSITVNVTNP